MVSMTGWRTRHGRTDPDHGGTAGDGLAQASAGDASSGRGRPGDSPGGEPPDRMGARLRAAAQAFRHRAQQGPVPRGASPRPTDPRDIQAPGGSGEPREFRGEPGERPRAPGEFPGERGAAAAEPREIAAGPRPIPAPPRGIPAGRGPAEPQVPGFLQRAAAWSWRLLLVGLLIYVVFRLASTLRLVVLPCVAALLLTALLQPLTARLRRAGLPRLAATWCTVLAAVIVLAGLATLAATRVSADYPTLSNEVKHTAHQVQLSLAGGPFHISSKRLQELSSQLVKFLSQHKSQVAGTVLTGGKIFLELLTGLVLMLFVTFFLLKDGERIWTWLVKGLSPEARQRADNAAAAAWMALTNYVRGTTAVAAIHAVFIGLALWILGVPLLVPLIILVFLAAYVPLVGILVAGALAILVTLGTRGWIAAVILLAIFLAENQIESHLLQPLVVGRIVRLHPLAIILVLAVGGVIAGIAGAIVAVPAAASISYAWPYLRRDQPGRPGPGGDAGPPGAPGPADGAIPADRTWQADETPPADETRPADTPLGNGPARGDGPAPGDGVLPGDRMLPGSEALPGDAAVWGG